MAADPAASPVVQVDAPHMVDTGACCSSCLSTAASLLRCSKCLHAWYCNQECQRKHFQQHKAFCKVLARFSALHADLPVDIRPKDAKEFYVQRLNARHLLEQLLKRPLTRQQSRAIMGEAKCSICMKTRDQLGAGVLSCCPTCHWGWACPEHERDYLSSEKHGVACQHFALMNKSEMYVHGVVTSAGKVPSYRPDTLFTTYQPLPAEGWVEYKRWRPLPNLEPAMMCVFSKRLSQPLTVMAGLQQHYSRPELESLQDLVIHVIGASAYEVPADGVWEELLHLLPGLRGLRVDFIGPEVEQIVVPEEDAMAHPKPVCQGCTAKGCTRTYTYHMCTYLEYHRRCQEQQQSSKPTLAIAFNCGMHDEDKELWLPSVQHLIDTDTPSVFTSYNEAESWGDESVWRSVGGNVTQGTALNPYHCLEPAPEPGAVDEFYFQSFYWFCGKGRAAEATA